MTSYWNRSRGSACEGYDSDFYHVTILRWHPPTRTKPRFVTCNIVSNAYDRCNKSSVDIVNRTQCRDPRTCWYIRLPSSPFSTVCQHLTSLYRHNMTHIEYIYMFSLKRPGYSIYLGTEVRFGSKAENSQLHRFPNLSFFYHLARSFRFGGPQFFFTRS